MKNSGAESSASNLSPPPNEESPRRRSGEGNTPNASPRGRSYPPRHPWELHLFTPPRPTVPPVMGVPGRSAFGPYRPPAPLWPSPGSGHGPSGSGFQVARAVPIGGGVAAAGALRIGGSPSGRKRGREGGAGSGGGGGGNQPGIFQHCSVCNKRFGSSKALFGHMRSHPDRGWKGVHPPPAFKAEEEFADLRVEAAALAEAAAKEAEDEAGEGTSYRVPDLNQPPPPDA
ncbi:C2H2-like zinc finger protein [Perilla frutescens var. frutescens]|nr:C2H2-like zinc finger protein [Perilla frutescens var. frutescens]